MAGSPAVPDRVPAALFTGFWKVNCQVPLTFDPVWENVKRAVPVPAKLSWMVPVHVPVRLGSSPPEQPSRAKVRASIMLHPYWRQSLPRILHAEFMHSTLSLSRSSCTVEVSSVLRVSSWRVGPRE